jgi:hypothetical protein
MPGPFPLKSELAQQVRPQAALVQDALARYNRAFSSIKDSDWEEPMRCAEFMYHAFAITLGIYHPLVKTFIVCLEWATTSVGQIDTTSASSAHHDHQTSASASNGVSSGDGSSGEVDDMMDFDEESSDDEEEVVDEVSSETGAQVEVQVQAEEVQGRVDESVVEVEDETMEVDEDEEDEEDDDEEVEEGEEEEVEDQVVENEAVEQEDEEEGEDDDRVWPHTLRPSVSTQTI